MRPIPQKLRKELAQDLFMQTCVFMVNCEGKVEWHHAIIYAGKQVNERWAILPVCEYHHRGPGFDAEYLRQIAYGRATPGDLAKYPKITMNKKQDKKSKFKKCPKCGTMTALLICNYCNTNLVKKKGGDKK